uniref:Family with sequence similarity 110 member D n=1 Tax=Takifugu rubripes TaxID=31033 RepID=H2T0K5_TAKRU
FRSLDELSSCPGCLIPIKTYYQLLQKENRRTSVDIEVHNRSNVSFGMPPIPRTPGGNSLVAPHSAPVLRRSSGKRMMRPDSLVIYRQKKECKSPSDSRIRRSSKTDHAFGSTLERTRNGFRNGANEGAKTVATNGNHSSNPDDDADDDPWKRASPQPAARRKFGELRRSKSDLRLRCSVALSEQDYFFDFCGLDMDMIQRLGRENFLSGASSIDTLSLALRSVVGDGCGGSEPSEFSRHSGDGLFEEELAEQLPTGVSIIERNARVIKWLYGCKNAAEEGPKESTV